MSGIEACATCHVGLIRRSAWNAMDVAGRDRAREWGFAVTEGRGLCRRCSIALRAGKTTETRGAAEAKVRADRIEDLEFMLENGESLAGASARVGMSESAVEMFLRRADRHDLFAGLRARNPRDWNIVRDGSDVTRLMPNAKLDRHVARRNETRKAQRRQEAAA